MKIKTLVLASLAAAFAVLGAPCLTGHMFCNHGAHAADLLYAEPVRPVTAAAAKSGLYMGGALGVAFQDDVTATANAAGTIGATGDFDAGYFGSLALGYKFANQFFGFTPRVELEAFYLKNELESIDPFGFGGGPIAASGNIDSVGAFANVLFDINLGQGILGRFTPYVGGGVGFADTNLDVSVGGINLVSDNDTGFAWNLQAGVSYDITPNTSLTLGYRYLQQEIDMTGLGPIAIDDSLSTHIVQFGARTAL